MTVRQFMLKKFPTNKYMDCPIPTHHWETIQEYADQYAADKIREKDEEIERVNKENFHLSAEITAVSDGYDQAELQQGIISLKNKLAFNQSLLTDADKEIERLKGLVSAQREYISFLDEAMKGANSIAYIHGFKYSEDQINKGIEFREKIKAMATIQNR